MKLVTTKFKSGGLREKHVVATWNVGNNLRASTSWNPQGLSRPVIGLLYLALREYQINPLAPELFFLISAQPVYKM